MLILATKDQIFTLINYLHDFLYVDKTASENDFIELHFNDDGVLEDFSEPIPFSSHDQSATGCFMQIQEIFAYARKRGVISRQSSVIVDGDLIEKVYPALVLQPIDPPTSIMLSQIPSLVHDQSIELSLGLSPFDDDYTPELGTTVLVPQIIGQHSLTNIAWASHPNKVQIKWMQAQL
ncbi:hypothetical protein [Flavobacterium sp.]|uniref:hypothetical protein n=1 Tax=Flavobacterium sp. TaxID=239 RepID=UPI00261403AE|nr:hypothetical protein [Flavobacterium sp.]